MASSEKVYVCGRCEDFGAPTLEELVVHMTNCGYPELRKKEEPDQSEMTVEESTVYDDDDNDDNSESIDGAEHILPEKKEQNEKLLEGSFIASSLAGFSSHALEGQEVLRRWNNLRDCFSRYEKRIKDTKTSGSKVIKIKKCMYFDQLQFQRKVYDEKETVKSVEQNKEQENEGKESTEVANVLDISTPVVTKSRIASKARKRKKFDEIDLRILKAIEGDKPCSKMAFLQSLMPHLQKFDNEEFLQFQMGVLKVIWNITEKKKSRHRQPPHFANQQFPIYPQLHFQPSTTTHCQSQQYLNASNQPPYYCEQLNMHGQTYAQMSIPKKSEASTIGNNQTPLRKELSHSSRENAQPSSAPRYFSKFASPDRDETDISVTSATSSIADNVGFN